jgi:general secretion pathway protein J
MNVSSRSRGFTLIEVVIATALLSLLLAGLLTAMRAFARSEARIDERIRIDSDLRVADGFLRGVVATVSPRTRPQAAGAPREIDFSGGAEEMRWIGVMPARHGAGGLYRFHLYPRPASGEEPAALVLEFAPFIVGFEAPLDPSAVQSRVMASPIGGVRFRYLDDSAAEEQWHEAWPHADRLPRRIGMQVLGATHPWPEMVVGVVPASGPLSLGRGGVTAGPTVGPR